MQDKKQALEPDMEQQIGLNLGKEFASLKHKYWINNFYNNWVY